MRTKHWPLYFLSLFLLCSCNKREKVDLLVYNGQIYTVDSAFSVVTAMAIRDGMIVETGATEDLRAKYEAGEEQDLEGSPVYPGFIDAHSHFYAYATTVLKADVTGTRSFDEVLAALVEFQKTNTFPWLLGQGWDQNDWEVKEFPTRKQLDSLFPNVPVFLRRIDGHAALCNNAALALANITANTRIPGGEVRIQKGVPTGLLIDNAADLVQEKIPPFPDSILQRVMLQGEAMCLAAGLTTVSDAGLGKDSILFLDKLQKEGLMKLRLVVMLSDVESTLKYFFDSGPLKTPRLNVRSVKLYGDGALGSRGACLLQPYTDAPGHVGFLLRDTAHMLALARRADAHGFQLCTHCIGDSATRTVLGIYGAVLKGPNDKRWRIEHCQVVHPLDVPSFAKYSILPSVQPTHATSDMYWAADRLGTERVQTAYAYADLLKASGHLAFGTDFPVENISPLMTFYAAVSRKDKSAFPPAGFESRNAVSPREALIAMTRDAAYSGFEDNEKGSLVAGKLADFVILDRDILRIPVEQVLQTSVVATYVGGERLYSK